MSQKLIFQAPPAVKPLAGPLAIYWRLSYQILIFPQLLSPIYSLWKLHCPRLPTLPWAAQANLLWVKVSRPRLPNSTFIPSTKELWVRLLHQSVMSLRTSKNDIGCYKFRAKHSFPSISSSRKPNKRKPDNDIAVNLQCLLNWTIRKLRNLCKHINILGRTGTKHLWKQGILEQENQFSFIEGTQKRRVENARWEST